MSTKAIPYSNCDCGQEIYPENDPIFCSKDCFSKSLYCSVKCQNKDTIHTCQSKTKPVPFNFLWKGGGENVVLFCSEDNFKPHSMGPLIHFLPDGKPVAVKDPSSGVEIKSVITNMIPGRYTYRFLVDGKWRCGPYETVDSYNILHVTPLTDKQKAHIFYKQWFKSKGPVEFRQNTTFSIFYAYKMWDMITSNNPDNFFRECVHRGNVDLQEVYQHRERKPIKNGMVFFFV